MGPWVLWGILGSLFQGPYQGIMELCLDCAEGYSCQVLDRHLCTQLRNIKLNWDPYIEFNELIRDPYFCLKVYSPN